MLQVNKNDFGIEDIYSQPSVDWCSLAAYSYLSHGCANAELAEGRRLLKNMNCRFN